MQFCVETDSDVTHFCCLTNCWGQSHYSMSIIHNCAVPTLVTFNLCGSVFSCFFYTLLSQWEFFPWEILVAFPKECQLQQSRATQRYLITKCLSCWGFLCFRNPLNSDVDYRIFNVCTWSFLYAIYNTLGLGTLTTSQHNMLTEKLNTVYRQVIPRGGLTPGMGIVREFAISPRLGCQISEIWK